MPSPPDPVQRQRDLNRNYAITHAMDLVALLHPDVYKQLADLLPIGETGDEAAAKAIIKSYGFDNHEVNFILKFLFPDRYGGNGSRIW